MARQLENWLTSYVTYASVTEAPKKMHFWSGVSCLAGTLRRKVWLDMIRFRWYPSFYIIFVAPPGVVSKSTTVDISMGFLREVPGINFGPDVVTWPALVEKFAAATESFSFEEAYHPMSALTLEASELGSLINPQDREMVNLYITLWDGRKSYEKVTKTSGNDLIEAPWINMIGCTTPHWIADNMPPATVGGGFTSRCIFIYADKKECYIPFVDEVVEDGDEQLRELLLNDLKHIADVMTGPFTITKEAREWEHLRYEHFWRNTVPQMNSQLLEGYAARKQTHLFKTAMVLSAAREDDRIITLQDLQLAETMLTALEPDMAQVFARIGKTEDSAQADKLMNYINLKGFLPYQEAYRQIHSYFPDFRDFEGIVTGYVRSGRVTLEQHGLEFWIRATGV